MDWALFESLNLFDLTPSAWLAAPRCRRRRRRHRPLARSLLDTAIVLRSRCACPDSARLSAEPRGRGEPPVACVPNPVIALRADSPLLRSRRGRDLVDFSRVARAPGQPSGAARRRGSGESRCRRIRRDVRRPCEQERRHALRGAADDRAATASWPGRRDARPRPEGGLRVDRSRRKATGYAFRIRVRSTVYGGLSKHGAARVAPVARAGSVEGAASRRRNTPVVHLVNPGRRLRSWTSTGSLAATER